MNGFFITFEGIDGCGKSVQARLLKDKLSGTSQNVLLLREPGTTPISEAIREILLSRKNRNMTESTELLLFSAARAQIFSETILPALSAGNVVICDRFYDSTTAYQGFGRKIDLNIIQEINMFAVKNHKPDLTILLDIDIDQAKARLQGTPDRMETSGDNFFHRVRQGFLEIARQEPERMVVISGNQSIAEIAKQIWQIVSKKLNFF